jgi:hypothetical protein
VTLSARVADSLLAVTAAVLSALLLSLALTGSTRAGLVGTSAVVATVKNAHGEVQVRAAQTLGWRRLLRGDEVHESDSVFVAPGAAAALAFTDGSTLDLDEKSLVVVESIRLETREVTLKQGSVSGVAGDLGLALVTAAGVAALPPRSEATFEIAGGQLEVAVRRGEARLRTVEGGKVRVGQGDRARAGGERPIEALPKWPVALVELAPNARRRVGSGEGVGLRWQGAIPDGARVQLASDRLFAFVVEELDASAGAASPAKLSPGVTWWRVVDAVGRPLSEARRFTSVDDVAPALLAPVEGEVVLVPEGQYARFTWTPLAGVTRYRFELSAARDFASVAVSESVSGSGVRWQPSLAEGDWFWRVSAADGEPLGSTPSPPQKFRLIRKALPSAPELFKPEVEVEL